MFKVTFPSLKPTTKAFFDWNKLHPLAIKHFWTVFPTSLAWMFILHRLCFVWSRIMWLIRLFSLTRVSPKWMWSLLQLNWQRGTSDISCGYLFFARCALVPSPFFKLYFLLCNNWHTKFVTSWLIHTLHNIGFRYIALEFSGMIVKWNCFSFRFCS